jgi:hypothetical protein
MEKVLIVVALIVILFSPPLHAQEQNIITGNLSGYGKNFIVVDGSKIGLCHNCKIYDDLDGEISIYGLKATETVTVTVKNGCAIKVKATLVRR